MSENILCVKNIKKSFGGVHALKGVDLTIKKGETHCLAGENGCGKSTIIKVISGFYKTDEGTIEIDGKEYTNMSTADAIAAGIQVIYQDFSIFPNLTVMENLAFNQVLAEKKKFVNKKEFRKIAEEAVKKINFDVDLDARVETLPVADKQLIAISRALLHNAKLIIMDEPTTALTKREVTRLFGIIEELKKEGITILFVSHKLDEVFEISDSITILLREDQSLYVQILLQISLSPPGLFRSPKNLSLLFSQKYQCFFGHVISEFFFSHFTRRAMVYILSASENCNTVRDFKYLIQFMRKKK